MELSKLFTYHVVLDFGDKIDFGNSLEHDSSYVGKNVG